MGYMNNPPFWKKPTIVKKPILILHYLKVGCCPGTDAGVMIAANDANEFAYPPDHYHLRS
jgi:hypothetical protein